MKTEKRVSMEKTSDGLVITVDGIEFPAVGSRMMARQLLKHLMNTHPNGDIKRRLSALDSKLFRVSIDTYPNKQDAKAILTAMGVHMIEDGLKKVGHHDQPEEMSANCAEMQFLGHTWNR
ncbi:MAG: hypothetical protein ABIH87_02650 [bacterium]